MSCSTAGGDTQAFRSIVWHSGQLENLSVRGQGETRDRYREKRAQVYDRVEKKRDGPGEETPLSIVLYLYCTLPGTVFFCFCFCISRPVAPVAQR